AWTIAVGNASELRKVADDLDRISNSSKQSYLQKTNGKITDEKLQELLDAETWLSADEAYQYGLADVILEENQMVASVNKELFSKYKNVPKQLQEEDKPAISSQEMAERKKIAEKANERLKTLQG